MSRRLISGIKTVLLAYAQVYFSHSPLTGMLLLAATLLVPEQGLAGLLGLGLSLYWAWTLGLSYQISPQQQHLYAANGLLLGLAMGYYFNWSLPMAVVLVLAELAVVMVTGSLLNPYHRLLGVPVLCLPFVIVTWLVVLASRWLGGVSVATAPVVSSLGETDIAWPVELLLGSLASVFFQNEAFPGLLVLAGLLWSSRWSCLLGAAGLVAGAVTWSTLGGSVGDLHSQMIGFNFVLISVAIGGVRLVLRPASMVLAVAAAAVGAAVSAALLSLLQLVGLPILALPFVLTTQLVLATVGQRTTPNRLQLALGATSPEQQLRQLIDNQRLLIGAEQPLLFLPVMGRWQVTQGPGGDHTHQAPWSHAWDFEVSDDEASPFRRQGTELTDYYAFGAPVVAPADGAVVQIVNHLPDNNIGSVDTVNNWGNLVILRHQGEVYSCLCHLQQGSVSCQVGEPVVVGQLLGRVGSSGRSPVPHLHFQVQVSSEIGAPTVPCELLHYLRSGKQGTNEYLSRGIPREGEWITAIEGEARVRELVDLAPGRWWQWTIQQGDQTFYEQWQSTIDPVGHRRLIVQGPVRAEASLVVDHRHLVINGYRGTQKSLLALLALGLPRLPFLCHELVFWRDRPVCLELRPGPLRLLEELLMPFKGLTTAQTRSCCKPRANGGARVITELIAPGPGLLHCLPDRIEVELAPRIGPVALHAYQQGRPVLSASLSEHPMALQALISPELLRAGRGSSSACQKERSGPLPGQGGRTQPSSRGRMNCDYKALSSM
jgi:urea transporter